MDAGDRPPFDFDGRTLGEVIAWAERESGRRIEGPSPAALSTVLHGSLPGLTPEQTLAAVLPSCGLALREAGAALRVEPEGGR